MFFSTSHRRSNTLEISTSTDRVQTIEALEPRRMLAGVNAYSQKNLDSDGGFSAFHVDANLKNPWGISFSTSGPFWVSDNGTGLTTLYDGSGVVQSLVVTIPGAGSASSSAPTGQVFNEFSAFRLANNAPAAFIFVGEDGGITAWNSASGSNAQMMVDRSAQDAIYKGVAIGQNNGHTLLYAADLNNARIDVFNSQFQATTLSGHFTDTKLPAGYAPFNIQNINDKLYVAFAKKGQGADEVDGAGLGYVDIFSTSGKLLQRLPHNNSLNAPWGFALAPSNFGAFSGDLLVGQFGSGKILGFDAVTGKFQGILRDRKNHDIVLPGLWGLTFGNGGRAGSANSLYFTAGPNDEANGILGRLSASTLSTPPSGGTTYPYSVFTKKTLNTEGLMATLQFE